MKHALFTDDRPYTQKALRVPHVKSLLELINEFSKYAEYKTNKQKSAASHSNNEQPKTEIKKTIPFKIEYENKHMYVHA